jgi:hypothetical protein
MAINVLSLSKRHVLGDLYDRCDPLKNAVPVYLEDIEPTLLGHVDESLGNYADAYSFHLEPDFCKKLSGGQFTYTVNYASKPKVAGPRARITITSITLSPRKGYVKPVPRRSGGK